MQLESIQDLIERLNKSLVMPYLAKGVFSTTVAKLNGAQLTTCEDTAIEVWAVLIQDYPDVWREREAREDEIKKLLKQIAFYKASEFKRKKKAP